MKSKMKIGLLLLIGVVLVFTFFPSISAEEEEPVEFFNHNLELAIKQQLGKAVGNVYPSELEKLTELHLHREEVGNLSWIKYCKHLEQLRLPFSNITDLSPLSDLKCLRILDLRHNDISDLSPLAELYSLQYVVLNENNITDIQPLVNNFKQKCEKIGLGEGDTVRLAHNYLDLFDGSKDLEDIQALLDRGVEVEYYPQKE